MTLKNRQGFTLVEVLIGVAIAAIVIWGGAQLIYKPKQLIERSADTLAGEELATLGIMQLREALAKTFIMKSGVIAGCVDLPNGSEFNSSISYPSSPQLTLNADGQTLGFYYSRSSGLATITGSSSGNIKLSDGSGIIVGSLILVSSMDNKAVGIFEVKSVDSPDGRDVSVQGPTLPFSCTLSSSSTLNQILERSSESIVRYDIVEIRKYSLEAHTSGPLQGNYKLWAERFPVEGAANKVSKQYIIDNLNSLKLFYSWTTSSGTLDSSHPDRSTGTTASLNAAGSFYALVELARKEMALATNNQRIITQKLTASYGSEASIGSNSVAQNIPPTIQSTYPSCLISMNSAEGNYRVVQDFVTPSMEHTMYKRMYVLTVNPEGTSNMQAVRASIDVVNGACWNANPATATTHIRKVDLTTAGEVAAYELNQSTAREKFSADSGIGWSFICWAMEGAEFKGKLNFFDPQVKKQRNVPCNTLKIPNSPKPVFAFKRTPASGGSVQEDYPFCKKDSAEIYLGNLKLVQGTGASTTFTDHALVPQTYINEKSCYWDKPGGLVNSDCDAKNLYNTAVGPAVNKLKYVMIYPGGLSIKQTVAELNAKKVLTAAPSGSSISYTPNVAVDPLEFSEGVLVECD